MWRRSTGDEPRYTDNEIFVSLRDYARRTGRGRAVGDNKGFRVNLSHRESFNPDAAFYTAPPASMKFFAGVLVLRRGGAERGRLRDKG